MIKAPVVFTMYVLYEECHSILGYKHYVAKWFDVLMPKIDRFLYGNGGNIIMVQV